MNSERSEHIYYDLPKANQDYAEVRTNAIIALISKYIPAQDDKMVLDVACGRGELLRALMSLGYQTEGLDYDENCVALSSQYSKCTQGNAYEIDVYFEKEAFDLVVCSHFLEHTESPKQYVEKLKRISKKYLLLVVPNLAQFITLEHKLPAYATKGHLCGWDPAHFKTFLELHCGLRIVEWQPDQVIIPGRPLWQKIPLVKSLFRYLEVKVLVKWLPYVSNSIIVLCEKEPNTLGG